MCESMLKNASLNSAAHSQNTVDTVMANEHTIHQQTEPSVPKPQICFSASAYRRYYRPNFDVYNSDGVVIGRDT